MAVVVVGYIVGIVATNYWLKSRWGLRGNLDWTLVGLKVRFAALVWPMTVGLILVGEYNRRPTAPPTLGPASSGPIAPPIKRTPTPKAAPRPTASRRTPSTPAGNSPRASTGRGGADRSDIQSFLVRLTEPERARVEAAVDQRVLQAFPEDDPIRMIAPIKRAGERQAKLLVLTDRRIAILGADGTTIATGAPQDASALPGSSSDRVSLDLREGAHGNPGPLELVLALEDATSIAAVNHELRRRCHSSPT